MKKKLLALAVVGACVAPDAMAQTANPVTLYGRIYVMYESVEASGGTTPVKRRNRIEDQSSFLGVRGTEDLGGGLKAFFQLETTFRADQNTTTFADRNSGVGLQGGWGSVLLGRWDTPFKVATGVTDPFGDLTIARFTVAMQDQSNFDRRDQNVIQYWTPSWGGFTARLMYQANEARTATLNTYDTGASVAYTGGPVYVFYAYERHNDPTATLHKEDGNALGGTVTFGPIKLGALYEEFKRTPFTGAGFSKRKSWMGNIVWTLGNHQFIYEYMKSKDGAISTAATQPDCDANVVGYQYNFTRRTFFLAEYIKVDNNAAANCNLAGTGGTNFAITNGQDPKGFAMGFRHIF